MKWFVAIMGILLVFSGIVGAENTPKMLTKEKEDILKSIQLLEENPFRKDARDLREKVLQYATDGTDVNVIIDAKFLKISALEYKYSKEMAFQYIAGCLKFDIYHPDLAFDATADIVSAIESVVITYVSILKEQPKEKNEFLDGLLSLKNSNRLTLENIKQSFQE